MSRYNEDLLLSCKSKEEIEEVKEKILKERRKEDLLYNCNHPLIMFPNIVPGYESYKTYKCLKCGAIIESGYQILNSRVNLKKEVKCTIYNFLHDLYFNLLNEEKSDREIVHEITNYYDFLIKENILEDINFLKLKEVTKLLNKSYELYKQIKNVVSDINKKKIKED